MSIRRVVPGDLETLAELCAEHAAYERAPFTADGQAARLGQALFGSPPRLRAWVVEIGGRTEGFASLTVDYSTWRARPFAHLDCLYLRLDARGLGWGSRLLDAVATEARVQGCDELQWQTPPWNGKAIAFYESRGARSAPKLRFGWRLESPGGLPARDLTTATRRDQEPVTAAGGSSPRRPKIRFR